METEVVKAESFDIGQTGARRWVFNVRDRSFHDGPGLLLPHVKGFI